MIKAGVFALGVMVGGFAHMLYVDHKAPEPAPFVEVQNGSVGK
ncbi:hypothetical protein DIDNDMLP_00161 [Klebsiella phage KP13-7]|nr:hypothetical protein DIDNDMLP_00161 [Klebsiella phage KP13-7]